LILAPSVVSMALAGQRRRSCRSEARVLRIIGPYDTDPKLSIADVAN
jgi:hypothetical protein